MANLQQENKTYQVNNCGGKENCNSSDNFTQGNSLSTDDSWKYLASILKADKVGSIDSHTANQPNTKGGKIPVPRNESVDDTGKSRGSKKEE